MSPLTLGCLPDLAALIFKYKINRNMTKQSFLYSGNLCSCIYVYITTKVSENSYIVFSKN